MRLRAPYKGTLTAALVTLWVVSLAGQVTAQEPVRISLSAEITSSGTPHDLALGRRGGIVAAEELDYLAFAHELVAFVLKEVLDESEDEYAGNSLLPSQLTASMPETDHHFKEHCLQIMGKLKSSLGPEVRRMLAPSVRGAVDTIFHSASTAFAARQIWSSLQGSSRDKGSTDTVSFRPKVGTNKVVMAATVRW